MLTVRDILYRHGLLSKLGNATISVSNKLAPFVAVMLCDVCMLEAHP